MKRIHIFTAGGMPLPPVNGGGVENLIQLLIEQNEYSSNEFVVYSIFDEKALKEAPKYKNTIFQYWKMSKLTSLLDCFIWNIFHGILKRETILFRNLLQRLKIILKTHQTIKKLVKKETNAIIVLEHSALLLFALLGIEKNDCKIFFHTHNNVLHEYKKLNKVVKKLDGVISISEYLKRTNAFFLQSCKNQYILKNAINSKLFSTTITDDVRFNDLKQKYNSENKKIIFFAGRLCPEKGVLEVVKSFKEIEKKYKDVRLLIAGAVFYLKGVTSDYERELLEEAKGSDICFTGYVPYSDINILYQMAYMSVLPSIWQEPAGLVIIESMHCGTPVITTNNGGIPEYAQDGVLYIDTSEDIVIQLTTKMSQVLDMSSQEYAVLKNKGIEISKEYTSELYYKNFMQIVLEY